MNALERECQSLVDALDDVLICGVVDATKQQVLAASGEGPLTPDMEGSLVAATLELLARPTQERSTISATDAAAEAGPLPFAEMQLTDARTRYFAKLLADGERVAVLVTHKDANAGLGWAQLKAMVAALDRLE